MARTPRLTRRPHSPELIRLGQRLRAQRQALGITQQALADQAGLNHSAIHYWETGQSEPRSLKLAKVAQLLNISVDELLGLDGAEAA